MTNQRIAAILRAGEPEETVTVQGWVRTKRELKDFAFVEVNDGSAMANLQVVINSDLPDFENVLKQLNTGASLEVSGVLVASPAKGQRIELKASQVQVYGDADPQTYPLQKKRHSFEFLRTIAHSGRAQTPTVLSFESAMLVRRRYTNFFKNAVFCGFTLRLLLLATAKVRGKCSPLPTLI